MVRFTPFRPTRALRSLCSPRNFILVTMVTITLWLYPPPRWDVLRRVVTFTEKNVPVTSTLSGNKSSMTNSSSFSSPPVVVHMSHSSTVLPVLASTIRVIRCYMSQRPPMVGTGQGNLMFMYASLLGIADRAQMVPDYPADGPLKKIFAISAQQLNPASSESVNEAKACAFDASLFSLFNRKRNLTVVGYLQSWRYFGNITDRIKQEFTFLEDFRVEAQNFLRSISRGNTATSSRSANDTLYIGVHIRRKDMLANYNVARGYTVANKEYLTAAVNHFRTKFPASTFVFVVCGDDQDWSKENFPVVDGNSFVAFSENRTAAQDMAILAACNHTIITVGTFGWWSGYLAGGQTIYYKNFPTAGSYIDSLLTKEDYFPPHWIGI